MASRNGRKAGARLPDFIAAGPPRTGTTWLHRVMSGHVGLPLIKETQFFAYNYHLGLDWYRSCFNHCPDAVPVGELAPTYFDHPQAPARIAEVIPDCRIIVSLRDPVERAFSQYKAWFRAGLIEGSFDYAKQRAQLAAAAGYGSDLRAWRSLLGAASVLVVLYEDLRSDPPASPGAASPVNLSERMPRSMTVARLIRQLRDELIRRRRFRLARLFEPATPLWNFAFTGGRPFPRLDPVTEQHLRTPLKPEVEELESLLGRDLSAWKTGQRGVAASNVTRSAEISPASAGGERSDESEE